MLRRAILDRLLAHEGFPAVTLLLPTHRKGRETQQDPIRLRKLLDEAAKRLAASDGRASETEALLAPARALLTDAPFWQHQDRGLAVFLADGFSEVLKVPFELPEEAVAGSRFHVKHILPAVADSERFLVLTASARQVRLFECSRDRITELDEPKLPAGLAEVIAESDYQNMQHSGARGRPRTRTTTGGVQHNFGEDPEELRKAQLVEYLTRVAAALESLAGDNRTPIVLAAQPEVHGHLRAALSRLPGLCEDGIMENPDDMDPEELRRLAQAIAEPRLGVGLREARARFESLLGASDGRAATKVEEIVRAAREGRVDTLFVALDTHLWGRVDAGSNQVVAHGSQGEQDEDLLDHAAAHTLLNGGQVDAVPQQRVPHGGNMAAILRY